MRAFWQQPLGTSRDAGGDTKELHHLGLKLPLPAVDQWEEAGQELVRSEHVAAGWRVHQPPPYLHQCPPDF